MNISTNTPLLLEVWDEESSTWKGHLWRELKSGMRFRNCDPLSGELVTDDEGHIDWTSTSNSSWEEGIWVVQSDPCQTNYVQRDPEGTLITTPLVPQKKSDAVGG